MVEDLSLQVQSGEIVGLLGPNGAGKTTAFYMIVGLVQRRWRHRRPRRPGPDVAADASTRASSGVGYLPQEASVFRRLSVDDNILGDPRNACRPGCGGPRARGSRRLLDELRIGHVRKNSGMSLSGGERRRVEIARALAAAPRFILLDEPFAGVDPHLGGWTSSASSGSCRARGIGVLITDHNVRETLGVCNRAYIVDRGTVIASGTAEEVLANERVREVYLGQNFRM